MFSSYVSSVKTLKTRRSDSPGLSLEHMAETVIGRPSGVRAWKTLAW